METNEVKILRNQQINNFMYKYEDLNNITVQEIEEGLQPILGEKPGVDFEYGVDFKLNEDTGCEDRIKGLKKIHIIYSYFDENSSIPLIGKMSYIVG